MCVKRVCSNSGGDAITEKALEHWNRGLPREQLQLFDMEQLLTLRAFNEKGEFDIVNTLLLGSRTSTPGQSTHVPQTARINSSHFQCRLLLKTFYFGDARPKVTFLASEHYRPCTRCGVREQLAQAVHVNLHLRHKRTKRHVLCPIVSLSVVSVRGVHPTRGTKRDAS